MSAESSETSTAARRGRDKPSRSVSMSAVLSSLVGLSLLAAFWQGRSYVRVWPDSLELAFVTTASFLLVWGLTELGGTFFFRRVSHRPAAASGPQPRLGVASWAGVVLVSLGTGALLLIRRESMLGYLPVLMIVVGGGLLLYGGQRFVDGLMQGRSRPTTTQRVALTRAGAMALIISVLLLAGAYLGPSNMLMLVFALVVGPFVVNGWYAFGMIRGLSLTRSVPSEVVAGEVATVTLSLRNRKRLLSSWLMTASDTVTFVSPAGDGESLVAETLFPQIPAKATRDAGYRLRLMRRGRYVFGPVRLRSRFPLGLVERSLNIELPAEMIVAPRLGRLSDRWRRETATAADLVQRQKPRRGAFPDEFEKLRLFRYGDNPRMIHWRTSARQNVLMVREYHEVRDHDLLILLDLHAAANDDESQLRVELAVSLAATICIHQLRFSRRSQLSLAVAGAGLTTWNGSAHPASAVPLLRELALVQSSPSPDVEALWNFARQHRSPATIGMIVTTRRPAELTPPTFIGGLRLLSAAEGFDDFFSLEGASHDSPLVAPSSA